jgi:hypothetical protein
MRERIVKKMILINAQNAYILHFQRFSAAPPAHDHDKKGNDEKNGRKIYKYNLYDRDTEKVEHVRLYNAERFKRRIYDLTVAYDGTDYNKHPRRIPGF